MKMRLLCRITFTGAVILLLNQCGNIQPHKDGPPLDADRINVNAIPNAIPRPLPLCRYGNPKTYTVFGKVYHPLTSSIGYKEKGIASWYGTQFHQHRTSCGEPYNLYAMTAASKTLPLPTFVKVTNLENGRQIIVKVNDRGPFAEHRIIDLSYVAARKLGMIGKGTALVEVEALNPGQPPLHLSPINKAVLHEGTPRIYLQIGAFTQKANAEALVKHLHAVTHYPVFILTRQNNSNVTISRVRLGPVPDVDTADALSESLKQKGFGDPLEVVDS